MNANPWVEFDAWYAEAVASGCEQPDAMALATATPDGTPSVRMVLFRGVSGDAIRFFTNYESRKGSELDRNPACAAVFHWPTLRRQVRFEGPAERLGDAESDAYFASRPTGHKLAAWASSQSRPLVSRAALEQRWEALRALYADGQVPRPPHWGGYRIAAVGIEFWTEGEHRLHHRTRFEKRNGVWTSVELQP